MHRKLVMKSLQLSLRFNYFKISQHRSEEGKTEFQIEALAMTISVANLSVIYSSCIVELDNL